jgi:hypothetical protein
MRITLPTLSMAGSIGHPAQLAGDGDNESFWLSAPQEDADTETLTIDLGGPAFLHGVSVLWAREYHARRYAIEASTSDVDDDDAVWVLVHTEDAGTGGLDEATVPQGTLRERVRYLRLTMMRDRRRQVFGVRDVRAITCPGRTPLTIDARNNCSVLEAPPSSARAASAPAQAACEPLTSASMTITPTVRAVLPRRGTTAGGTDVTIYGNFFGAAAPDVNVSIGGFPCTVTAMLQDQSGLTCKTTASGVSNGGMKQVRHVHFYVCVCVCV